MEKRKKGVAHVEIIVSFVIFISFLIFILMMIKPWNAFSRSTSSLDITKTRILDYVSTNLSIFSLKINSSAYFSATKDCFNANFDSSLIDGKLIMKNEAEEIIDSTIKNNNLYFEKSGMFYKIYSSEEFEEKAAGTAGCYALSKDNYILGVKRIYKKVSYSKLTGLFEEYADNYEQFKVSLGLKNDFNLAVLNSSGGVIGNFKAEKYKPEAIEVAARNIPIEILDENATLNIAIMNLQVW